MLERKAIKKIILAAILFAMLFCFFFQKEKIEIHSEDITHFDHLDIIISNGQSAMSKMENIFNFTSKSFSHIGILVQENGQFYVLHATPDGTPENGIRYDAIQTFINLSNVNYFEIFRFKNLSCPDIENINTLIAHYKTQNLPFDYSFDNLDKTKIYCSELVYDIFKTSTLWTSAIDLNKLIYPEKFTGLKELEGRYERKASGNFVMKQIKIKPYKS
jgi:hypothetical protein